jgi:hypothetical protein
MKYYKTIHGTILDEDYIVVQQIEGTVEYENYLDYLRNEGTLYDTDFIVDDDVRKELIENIVEVPLWRVRTILKVMDLETTIQSAIEELPEPTKTAAKYIWQFGTVIERKSQTVLMIQQILEMTNEQVDDLFIQANNLTL